MLKHISFRKTDWFIEWFFLSKTKTMRTKLNNWFGWLQNFILLNKKINYFINIPQMTRIILIAIIGASLQIVPNEAKMSVIQIT